jgi:aspartyl-tRNA(Asn)/glutamyl-tRNA(Gln) amidotransferase subunit B
MKYDVVIGLEVHVQVQTATKIFCRCPNRSGAEPNTLICPVCMGYPGVLPVPNREAVRKTILAGLMCDCKIAEYSKFDRKSYFYPDMPKNFQTSQYDLPLCGRGYVQIAGIGFSGEELPAAEIGITRIHLEEDVGKSTHFGEYSGIDYNRAGVPLMEIVSEPDMTSPDQAYAYLTVLKQAMQYGGISDCDMEKGQLRCDVNVSLKPAGRTELGAKIELKNLNSFKSVHRALESDIERQAAVLDGGGELLQETRGWDDDLGDSYFLRRKEGDDDYRYFPEPDLMPMAIDNAWLEEIRAQVPETPEKRRDRFVAQYSIPEYDAGVLTADRPVADYYEETVNAGAPAKKASNWIMVELMRELSQANVPITESPISPTALAQLVTAIESADITGRQAKDIFVDMFKTGNDLETVKATLNIVKTDDSEIRNWARQAITANPKPVAEFKEGNEKSMNFLVGQVMKASRGNANPQSARQILIEELGKS